MYYIFGIRINRGNAAGHFKRLDLHVRDIHEFHREYLATVKAIYKSDNMSLDLSFQYVPIPLNDGETNVLDPK